MKVDLFDFDLPEGNIALRPARPRDSARLLLVEGERLTDKAVRDLPALLGPSDVLVFNDTKVIPAQLEGSATPGSERRCTSATTSAPGGPLSAMPAGFALATR
jgi:S-adenosylmethionine:tRNA-ribosyltransferase-isomerase (queuine synthetase)